MSVLCAHGCCFECDACAAKPGTPILCQDCLRRRAECAARHPPAAEPYLFQASWQPIATAPRDGTAFLGFFPGRRGYVARQDVVPIWWCGWGGGIWQNATSGHNMTGDEPTHWMPLPEAPLG